MTYSDCQTFLCAEELAASISVPEVFSSCVCSSFGSGLDLEPVSFGPDIIALRLPCVAPLAHLRCCGITGFTCKRNRQVSSSKKLILFHSVVHIRRKFRLYRSLHSVSQVQFSLGVWNLYRRYFFSCAPTLTPPTPLITRRFPWQRGSVSQGWSNFPEHLCFFPVTPEESGLSSLPVRAGTLARSLSCDIAHAVREERKETAVNLK